MNVCQISKIVFCDFGHFRLRIRRRKVVQNGEWVLSYRSNIYCVQWVRVLGVKCAIFWKIYIFLFNLLLSISLYFTSIFSSFNHYYHSLYNNKIPWNYKLCYHVLHLIWHIWLHIIVVSTTDVICRNEVFIFWHLRSLHFSCSLHIHKFQIIYMYSSKHSSVMIS